MDLTNFWFSSGAAGGGGGDPGDPIGQSLRFRGGQRLTRSGMSRPAGDYTYSVWVKCAWTNSIDNNSIFGNSTSVRGFKIGNPNGTNANQLACRDGTSLNVFDTGSRLRDPSAWYHFVFQTVGTDTTAFVNGVQLGNAVNTFSATGNAVIGSGNAGNMDEAFHGYMAEVYCIDGQTLAPTAFGRENADGVWVPVAYDGDAADYGANGFHLTFEDPNDIGEDSAPVGATGHTAANDFTPDGFELTDDEDPDYDLMQDSPTQNYATLNPLATQSGITLSAANMQASTGNYLTAPGTIAMPPNTGQYYFEINFLTQGTNAIAGLVGPSGSPSANIDPLAIWCPKLNAIESNGLGTLSNIVDTGATPVSTANGEVYMYAYDSDTQRLWVGQQGTWYRRNGDTADGDPAAGTNPLASSADAAFATDATWTAGTAGSSSSGTDSYSVNVGQQPFIYTPPEGFERLQTDNLPEATIANSSDHFRALSGTGANILDIAEGTNNTGDNWNPDINTGFENGLYIIKSRTNTEQWQFVDSTNGDTSVPRSPANTAPQNYFEPGGTALAWCWNAPDAFTNDDVTSGRRNENAGFSIINYTGDGTNNRRIAHGLDTESGLMILFNPDGGDIKVWVNGLTGTGTATQNLILNTGEAASNQFSAGTIHAPDNATDFIVGLSSTPDANISGVNANGNNYRAFIWAPVPGYSAFGSFTGNSSNNGPFIYCGFKPALVWIQAASQGGGDAFFTADTTCQLSNPYGEDTLLNMAQSSNEGSNSARPWDMLSNGFKIRNNSGSVNTGNVVWAAWAQNPFGGENVSPANAR